MFGSSKAGTERYAGRAMPEACQDGPCSPRTPRTLVEDSSNDRRGLVEDSSNDPRGNDTPADPCGKPQSRTFPPVFHHTPFSPKGAILTRYHVLPARYYAGFAYLNPGFTGRSERDIHGTPWRSPGGYWFNFRRGRGPAAFDSERVVSREVPRFGRVPPTRPPEARLRLRLSGEYLNQPSPVGVRQPAQGVENAVQRVSLIGPAIGHGFGLAIIYSIGGHNPFSCAECIGFCSARFGKWRFLRVFLGCFESLPIRCAACGLRQCFELLGETTEAFPSEQSLSSIDIGGLPAR